MTAKKTSSKAKKPVVSKEKKLFIAFGPNESDKYFDVNIGETVELAASPEYFYDTPNHKIVVLNVSDFLRRFERTDGKELDVLYVFDDRGINAI